MLSFWMMAFVVVGSVVTFVVIMNRHGEKLEGDEESPPILWADDKWYKDDGPPDG
ncbi:MULTISPECIES: hypothetical protein [Exiguobacterium]|uniref:Uncharacterized protein n=1 Tax=Exiguobacterium aurantiacum TaxID=33987 RepID=A0A377FXJ0_9BACL|nr:MULTISPECIES: hypothetical protein [Exiguobacterium]STO09155.1 Uncharacterised protein [Exiguobacterium aurantiacum]